MSDDWPDWNPNDPVYPWPAPDSNDVRRREAIELLRRLVVANKIAAGTYDASGRMIDWHRCSRCADVVLSEFTEISVRYETIELRPGKTITCRVRTITRRCLGCVERLGG